MTPLKILICGGDVPTLQRMAQQLADEGATVATSTGVIDSLCFSGQEWDFLLIDLDGLNSFLRSLLPAISRKFPALPIIGLSARPQVNLPGLGYGLALDDVLSEFPSPEELIVRFPHVAAKYLCDTGSLTAFETQPLSKAIPRK